VGTDRRDCERHHYLYCAPCSHAALRRRARGGGVEAVEVEAHEQVLHVLHAAPLRDAMRSAVYRKRSCPRKYSRCLVSCAKAARSIRTGCSVRLKRLQHVLALLELRVPISFKSSDCPPRLPDTRHWRARSAKSFSSSTSACCCSPCGCSSACNAVTHLSARLSTTAPCG